MGRAAVVFVLIAALTGCGKNPRQAPPMQKITVACTSQPQGTLVHVAVVKGFFAEEGLTVERQMHPYGKVALQSLLENKADFATVAETPVMLSVLRGERFFVIANIEASTQNNAIVARRDAGISVLGDLKGKRIGFTPGTTSDFFLDSLLTTIGLRRSAVQPVPLDPDDMPKAMSEKKVDAVCTWNYPLTRIKRQLGPNGILFFDREIYTETFNIAVRQELVQGHPATVQSFLRALVKAERFVAGRPEEAQALIATATGTELEIVKEVWNAFNYRVRLDQTLRITLEDETRWAMKNGLTDRTVMPDYRNYIHLEGIRTVKPDAVLE